MSLIPYAPHVNIASIYSKYSSPHFFFTEESHSLQFFQLWDHGLQDLVHHLSHLVLHVVEGVSNAVGVVNVCERILRARSLKFPDQGQRDTFTLLHLVWSLLRTPSLPQFLIVNVFYLLKNLLSYLLKIILLLCPYSGVCGPTTFTSSLPILLSYHPILLFHLVLFGSRTHWPRLTRWAWSIFVGVANVVRLGHSWWPATGAQETYIYGCLKLLYKGAEMVSRWDGLSWGSILHSPAGSFKSKLRVKRHVCIYYIWSS